MMNISKISAKAFCTSIEKTLGAPYDIDGSITKIQKTLNRMPDKHFYYSDQGVKVAFYTRDDGKLKYLSKKSISTHMLARRRYLLLLVEILKLCKSNNPRDIVRRKALFTKLVKLIDACERGNLDIARIVLTSKQYKWFMGQFRQKYIDVSKAKTTSGGLPVRSKSERDIANIFESLAVPFHYEEQTVIYVHNLVIQLEEKLKRENRLRGPLYSFSGGDVHWNVPPELEWMNAPGSIWKTYYPPKGTITIYNDFKIMLADDEIIIWEHEGLMEDYSYRCNASERASVMKYTGTVSKGNLIETYEQDVDTADKITALIEEHILLHLWF